MNIKETLNQIYGKSAATNTPIKDNITQEDIMNTIKVRATAATIAAVFFFFESFFFIDTPVMGFV